MGKSVLLGSLAMREFKLPYGVRDGVALHISQVERGLACNCRCPGCGEPLVARKGSVKSHHFAHAGGAECATATETALHLAAKQILAEHKAIALPAVEVHFTSYRPAVVVFPAGVIALDEVRLENRTADVVPDVLAYVGGKPLMVGMRVTHKVDEAKLAKIQRLGISAIEVDLSDHDREFAPDQLADLLVRGSTKTTWLFNIHSDRVKRQFLKTGEFKRTVYHGMALHADHCPISIRVWHGKPYANVTDDCAYCDYALDVGPNMESLICGGKHKVTTMEALRAFYANRPAADPT